MIIKMSQMKFNDIHTTQSCNHLKINHIRNLLQQQTALEFCLTNFRIKDKLSNNLTKSTLNRNKLPNKYKYSLKMSLIQVQGLKEIKMKLSMIIIQLKISKKNIIQSKQTLKIQATNFSLLAKVNQFQITKRQYLNMLQIITKKNQKNYLKILVPCQFSQFLKQHNNQKQLIEYYLMLFKQTLTYKQINNKIKLKQNNLFTIKSKQIKIIFKITNINLQIIINLYFFFSNLKLFISINKNILIYFQIIVNIFIKNETIYLYFQD
ncbi:transmembrane protein, putative (macronuclear) [Tetrahymena thermophila SB210]|uniref:Transmembrane protein, putative n=1 Tax=Tetrahymena thermophila (strain SB210) TaxID=312017 RepID=W7XDV3_TETTS|nr:transmembrane protein, putative [Tetrahymena thermophila SB210]EWS72051.1 transmembrane protein, putative [Tetrahymena thermophila SB210]|eukprot:XP_012655426.1 transmembrane protein, putative [Tetrahymena thermophila SB210]